MRTTFWVFVGFFVDISTKYTHKTISEDGGMFLGVIILASLILCISQDVKDLSK